MPWQTWLPQTQNQGWKGYAQPSQPFYPYQAYPQ